MSVGFKLTDDGDYDIQNKKLTNVASPQTNDDATTKSYVDVEVSKTLKKDGTDQMNGLLDMNYNRIENVGNGRHGTTDTLTHMQFEAFYFDLNTDSGNIEAQNPINMKNERILGVKDPILHSDASNKFYVDNSLNFKADKTQLSDKADKTELANYLKKDGSVALINDLDLGDNEIVNVKEATSDTHAINLGQLNSKTAEYLPLKGAIMEGDIEVNSYTILGIRDENRDNAVVSRKFVKDELNKKADSSALNDYVRINGDVMKGDLDMNNQRIKNVKDATHNQDAITLKQVNDAIATISTDNNKYTDQKIAESHISTYTNRKNVLKYAMDDGEFTEDAGIQDVNLMDFNDMPHKTNKKAFSMKVQRTNDGSSEYKGRFDFNLFKVIRDNFSDHYTVCLETYFQKSPFCDYEFGSTVLSFEALNIDIDTGLTIKVSSEYKYLRTILNLSPDGTSKQIQRRLYVNFKNNFDNSSPVLLPIFVLIYGIKDEAKSDLDMTIYDYEKAYEVANNKLQIHIPIIMNNNGINGLPRSPIDDNGPLTRRYMRLVSFPCLLVGTTEIGTRTFHFSYEMQLDGTTTNIRLSSVLKTESMYILKVVIWTNKPLNGTYKLIINNRILAGIASNVNGLVYNLNSTYHGFNRILIESSDRVRKRFFYTIHCRPYNF